ncbi:MAG: bifunctional ornithine acetyltransferase/N-acetylglutamate synthase, partial [Gammaproteobacteria bacterium]|nr:bifunctional ornithine acetyltransferase/N-acetylglutamate synthase [Gammaproteobacteria bacterium]
PVTLCGVAKGSGMIAPNMATMLAFCFTDAQIPEPQLHEMLLKSADRTFNAITVDSDTSTSDMLLLFATGKAGNDPPNTPDDPRFKGFRMALDELLRNLAIQIVRDGEGASKLIEVRISGAESDASARKIADSIANSPLVKTAIAGGDANWGRIIMALGKSGENMQAEHLLIRIGGELVAKGGQRAENYDESRIIQHLEGSEILIEAELQIGRGECTIWTCDLTHGYISINADYRS